MDGPFAPRGTGKGLPQREAPLFCADPATPSVLSCASPSRVEKRRAVFKGWQNRRAGHDDADAEASKARQENLISEKYNLRAKIRRAQGGACQWLEPVVNLINQAKSMPNSIKTANQAELSQLIKTVGLNRALGERSIKVWPRSAWKTLFFSRQKEGGGFAPAFISSGDSPNLALVQTSPLGWRGMESPG